MADGRGQRAWDRFRKHLAAVFQAITVISILLLVKKEFSFSYISSIILKVDKVKLSSEGLFT